MDARPQTRQIHRERKAPTPQLPRGAKQIVLPMTRAQYDELWHHADRMRAFLAECAEAAPSCSRHALRKAIPCTAWGVSRASSPG